MSLRLADTFIKYLIGILLYVSIRISQMYITIGFVIMEMKEYYEIPIILDITFLVTTGIILSMK